MNHLRIVFLGTPEFAVESLKALVEAGKNIVGVITAPDKPRGRGKKLAKSAVKEYAESAGLVILQPTNLKDPGFQEELRSLRADLQVVVAFRMLPESVWNMPREGTFNLHASLLPQYRGAAPINWAIINGETETGVTTFKLKHEIDTGNIYFQEKEPIHPEDTVGELYLRLMKKGADLVVRTVDAIEQGTAELKPQPASFEIKPAPKIFKEDCRINWELAAESIYNFIRGLSPYPAAWTRLHDKQLKIFRVEVISSENLSPGEFASDGKNWLKVGTGSQDIKLLEIQFEGKKRMRADEFLRGYQWPNRH